MVCDRKILKESEALDSLNPYSIGIWSATIKNLVLTDVKNTVLILILLEYGLRQVAKTL